MSDNIERLRNMLITFRVSELQMLLGFAGRNKSGRKTELQQRALELLHVRSHPIHQKIRELYETIQQSGALNNQQAISSDLTDSTLNSSMPQQQGVSRASATVHPYNVDARMSTRQATIYGQNIYQQYQHYQKPQQTVMTNTYPVHPDVRFRRLPFFDVIADLLKPSSLVPQNNQRLQEGTFYFHLTPQQATDVASSRDIRPGSKCEYIKQVQLRFCLLETTCEQEDYFPPNVVVKVNNKLCPLPNPIPTNKPGVEPKRPPRPVNITPMVKLSPTVANAIHVSWAADYGRGYAITVALVHKRNSNDLLQRLKSRGVKHSDHTRGLIKEKLNEDADGEIATTCLRVSLMCPLGKMRMSTPCRSITCQHLQCFDASLYLQMNERKPTWNCPVCDKPALYDNLVIDGYFQEVLSASSTDVSEIQLHKDGSWSSQLVEKKVVAKVEKVPDDSIEIISDDVGMEEHKLEHATKELLKYRGHGMFCAYKHCKASFYSTDKEKLNMHFFSFPQDKKMCEIWLQNSGREDLLGKDTKLLNKNYRLCSLHFDDEMFVGPDKNRILPLGIPRRIIEVVSSASNQVESSSNSEKPKDESAPPAKEKDVVDLTVSDSDDDEPLAKRRALNPKPDSTNKFSDTTSVSSSSNQSRVTSTPGPSSVSSSGYPASPSVINLDSPSPPRSPQSNTMAGQATTSQPPSCMMMGSNGNVPDTSPIFTTTGPLPFLDLESEANSRSGYNF